MHSRALASLARRAGRFLLAAVGVCLPGPLAAGESGMPPAPEVAQVELLPGWRAENGRHIAGLRITLAPGWKTYWRAPGDAGIPPRFDWSGSRNLTAVTFHWPTPQVIRQNGMTTIGYSKEVILPLELTAAGPGPIALRGELELGVCESVCMPMSVRLSADLGPDAAPDPRIMAALARQPVPGARAGVRAVHCAVEEIADGLRVTARVDMPPLASDVAGAAGQQAGEVAVFELPDRAIWISEAAVRREGATLVATAEMVPPAARPFPLDPGDLRITIFGSPGQAVDINGCTG